MVFCICELPLIGPSLILLSRSYRSTIFDSSGGPPGTHVGFRGMHILLLFLGIIHHRVQLILSGLSITSNVFQEGHGS